MPARRLQFGKTKREFDQITRYGVSEGRKSDFLTGWFQIVDLYSNTNLIVPTDRLLAFSGMMAAVQERTRLTPFFGLWEEALVEGLLWKVWSRDRGDHLADYRVPSFSWASVDTPIYHAQPRGRSPWFSPPILETRDRSPKDINLNRFEPGYVAHILNTGFLEPYPAHFPRDILRCYITITGEVTEAELYEDKDNIKPIWFVDGWKCPHRTIPAL